MRLTDVLVAPEQIIAPDPDLAEAMDQLTTVGLIWFQLTVCAAYTGIASVLVEKVLSGGRGSVSDRAALAVRIESAAALTEGLARRMMDGETDNDTLAAALVTRYAVQDAVARDRQPGGRAARRHGVHRQRRHRLPGRRVAGDRLPPAVADQRGRRAGRLLRGYPMVVA